jgi:hypothetical protein
MTDSPSPLFCALLSRDEAGARAALAAGADVNEKVDGYPIIGYAIAYRNWHLITEMLKRNVDLRATTPFGRTIAHAAMHMHNMEVFDELLAAGLEIDTPDASGTRPIYVALHEGNANIVRKLLERGVKLPSAVAGHAPLEFARRRGFTDLVCVLEAATVFEAATVREARSEHNVGEPCEPVA